jgi:2-oxoglutarate dehydrogenase E1 component
MRFNKDVVIDMICYRRHGHNEGDEPAFTQPLLYKKIKNRPSIRNIYTEQLIAEEALTREEADALTKQFRDKLQQAFKEARENKKKPVKDHDAVEKKYPSGQAKKKNKGKSKWK